MSICHKACGKETITGYRIKVSLPAKRILFENNVTKRRIILLADEALKRIKLKE
jgi:hypothetical protein